MVDIAFIHEPAGDNPAAPKKRLSAFLPNSVLSDIT